MLIYLLILGFIIPIITGLLAYLQNKNMEIKRLEAMIIEERKPPNTKETSKEAPYNLPVTERNKIIKEYTSLNLNLSQELLSSYKIMEFNNRQSFIDFIDDDLQKRLSK